MSEPTWYVLEHKSCGHLAGAGTERRGLEAQLRLLTTGGYHRWRVRRVRPNDVDDVLTKVLADEKCATCTIDPSRAHQPMVGKAGTRGSGPYESAFAIAVVDAPWAIDQARQVAHDTVINNTGQARRSGVQWTHYAASTAIEDLADYGIDKLPELAQLCALFPAGVVVMATVSVNESVTP